MNSQLANIAPTARISAQNNSLTAGSVSGLGWSDVHHYWWPSVPVNNYITTSTWHQTRPNATEMAFKIVSKLMERGKVPDLTVNEFVELVDDVALIVKES